MIQIYRGSVSDLNQKCLEEYQQRSHAFWLDGANTRATGSFGVFWAGIRLLLNQMQAKFGAVIIENAIHHHRAAASLVLDQVTDSLHDSEIAQRDLLKARFTSHLNHNWFMQIPLLEEWATLLNRLFSTVHVTLILPNIYTIDVNTIGTIITYYRLFQGTNLNLIIGYPDGEVDYKPDANGITWCDLSPKHYETVITNFRTLPDTTLTAIPFAAPQTSVAPDLQSTHNTVFDSGHDYKLYRQLSDPATDFDAEKTDQAIACMARAFESFDFRIALDFGIKILQKCANLSSAQKALVHGAIGMSAHNRQFDSAAGNQQFNDFLETHFQQAVALEANPTIRICYYYRLVVTLSRRKKELSKALTVANQAFQLLQQYEISKEEAALQEAWLRNIRAYIYSRNHDNPSAVADIEEAYRLVDTMTPSTQTPERELIMTASVIADNRSILADAMADRHAEEYWITQGNKMFRQGKEGARYVEIAALEFYFAQFRIDRALQAAVKGFEDACQHFDAWWQRTYLLYISHFSYKVGDLGSAQLRLETLLDFYERLAITPKQLPIKVMLGLVLLRQGRFRQAEVVLDKISAELTDLPLHIQAETYCLRALVAAQQQMQQQAESFINRAIDIAVAGGERDTLLMVARRAGDICRTSQQIDKARQAYQQALSIAAVALESTNTPPSAEMVGIYLGLIECGMTSAEFMIQAVTALAQAVQENAEAWWELPRTLPVLHEALCNSLLDSLNPTLFKPILMAASQRVDCADHLVRLRPLLPVSLHQYIFTPERSLAYAGD